MKRKRYTNYAYVIGYLILLRVVLAITVGINFFSLGIIFDLFLVMFWVGAIAIFMKKLITQKIFYVIVVLISTVFAVGDSIYYDYFETISAKKSFAGLKWLQEGTTLEYDISIPLVAYLVTPILIGVIYLIITNKKKDIFVLKDFAILSSVFVVQVILFIIWGSYNFDTPIEYYRSDAYLFESMYDRVLYSEKYGYYNYHVLDFTKIRRSHDVAKTKIEIDKFFDEQEPHVTNDMSDIYNGYNVITIIGETLETRFIDPVLTPNLFKMMDEGMSFDNFYTPVFQQGATCNSEFMSLSGLGAITTNDWSNNICDSYGNNTFSYSLPSQLKEQGYDTYYFHGGHEWFYNREEVIPSYGFETVKFQEDFHRLGIDYIDKFDSDMMMFFDEFVDYSNPFYINLLTYSGHGAYNQVEFFKYADRVEEAYPNNDFDSEVINYMEKLVELDTLVGDLLVELENQGVLDNTIIAIYPDHFPYMMNTETYTEYIGIDEDSYEIMKQKLIIYATNMDKTVVSKAGATVDITPTLLNMVNSNSEFKYFTGTDLFSLEDNYILFSDLTISDGSNFLFINKKLFGDESEFSDLETALEQEISAFEIQKKLLEIDYFKVIKDE